MAGVCTALGFDPGFITPATIVPYMRATLSEMCFFQRELVKLTSSLGDRSVTAYDEMSLPVVSDSMSLSEMAMYMLILRPAMEICKVCRLSL